MSARRTRPARWVGALLMVWGAAALVLAAPAHAQNEVSAEAASTSTAATTSFDIPAQDLGEALADFARQSGQEMLYAPSTVAGKTSTAINGRLSRPAAMQQLLDGTGLLFEMHESGSMIIGDEAGIAAYRERMQTSDASAVTQATAPAASPAPITDIDTARRAGVEEIIVTGQKKAERLQDVPIAISAFSMETLDAQKIEGGFDLLKAVPNVTFSKTNFSGYNFQIRGIGTQAISATTDPGVAVSYNNTTLIVNRLFEQEYLDIERVEVLRGPQGTLYGRNANAGVINVIPAKPEFGEYSGELKLETGNYNAQRIRGHYNIPLNEDTLALRLAYASTVRDGYVTNEFDNKPIDGRDLATTRISLGWQPTGALTANFSWERFDENDNRLRSAKNLCHRDNGPEQIANLDLATIPADVAQAVRRGVQQGCLPGSLYSNGAYGTPNGDALPFVTAGRINNQFLLQAPAGTIGLGFFGGPALLTNIDVYANARQSNDLRTVYSPIKPQYKAKADVFDLSLSLAWTDAVTLNSYTVYAQDELFSTQDFTRFAASPGIFTDIGGDDVQPQYADFAPGGVFCDPQLGCSDSFRAQDISQSKSSQFNQQFEVVSDFDGLWNFSLGVNFTRFETKVDYLFFSNVLTALAQTPPFNGSRHPCTLEGRMCVSVQTDDLNGTAANPYGHNFFLSRNPYELNSAGLFGESYWQVTPSLKITLGLRFTWDRKVFTPTPSQTLLADYREASFFDNPSVPTPNATPDQCITLTLLCGILGNAPGGIGYPTDPDIIQTWREPTGRFIVNWSPILPFTDETMIYASYSRGYKGGGANPPSIAPPAGNFIEMAQSAVISKTFDAEYVNAFEVGTKNTLLGGGLVLNATAFYYDYTNYQVSKIVDRTAANENFNAAIWGAELEVTVAPTPEWVSNAAVGYLRTQLDHGEQSIDLMDRTQGGSQFYITNLPNPAFDPNAAPIARENYVAGLVAPEGQAALAFNDWVVVKPNAAQSSNCVAPADVVADGLIGQNNALQVALDLTKYCAGGNIIGDVFTGYDPIAGAPNGGAGFFADLSGHELPNAPRFTVSLGTQYTFHLPAAWDLTGRMDWYWQDQSYARVYNTKYDRLRAWANTNVSLWVDKPDWDLRIEAYVKNLFDETPITGAFLNSDDTGLTTNIFTLDPRLVGVSITKRF
ncbi:TonB-dependent receptor [Flagellatimonas centrodinii]|uniref:TonB-dependent receptor domain-containing protein n=1 Tax=Flagellatimonas centrodinii TaxID=2806210 RepID=UPI001FF05AC8|nr:TonB-dependent receptor [Flagellatimonas centrodinii]ULQ47714.1 TonB-dependent receptor [Flagellatimonas centrodinii]